MPITSAPGPTTSSNLGMGSFSPNLPNLNLPNVNMGSVDPKSITTDPGQVYKLLAQKPQSLTDLIGPLLQQIFGTQGNLMQPIFAQQGEQGAAQTQSDAMARGLTGSSI